MFDESTRLCDVKYKIVFLGQSAVGKSALIERFIQGNFDPRKTETVGIDFLVKNVTYLGAIYRLQLWDTAGQEKFKSLVPNYIRDAHCAVFVYDIQRPDSFTAIDSWLQLFKEHNSTDAVSVLVGNKLDMASQRKVGKEEGQEKAVQCGIAFCETSAMNGSGVQQLFHSIIENIQVAKSRPSLEGEQPSTAKGSTSSSGMNKTKIVKIPGERRDVPCCYI